MATEFRTALTIHSMPPLGHGFLYSKFLDGPATTSFAADDAAHDTSPASPASPDASAVGAAQDSNAAADRPTGTVADAAVDVAGVAGQRQAQGQEIAIATRGFAGDASASQLTMRAHDVLVVLERAGENWWRVRHAATHVEGFVPAAYVQVQGQEQGPGTPESGFWSTQDDATPFCEFAMLCSVPETWPGVKWLKANSHFVNLRHNGGTMHWTGLRIGCGTTALMNVRHDEDGTVSRWLIALGADPSAVGDNGETVFANACQHSSYKFIVELADQVPAAHLTTAGFCKGPIWHAFQRKIADRVNVVKFLVLKGSPVESVDLTNLSHSETSLVDLQELYTWAKSELSAFHSFLPVLGCAMRNSNDLPPAQRSCLMMLGGHEGVLRRIRSFAGVRDGVEIGRLRRAEAAWGNWLGAWTDEGNWADQDDWADWDLAAIWAL